MRSRTRERGDALVAAYEKGRQALDASPECLAYELAVCEEDPTSYILRIEWTSTEAHILGFRKGAQFPPFLRAIGAFVKDITEMRHYRVAMQSGGGGRSASPLPAPAHN